MIQAGHRRCYHAVTPRGHQAYTAVCIKSSRHPKGENVMRRRKLLQIVAGASLAAPRIAGAQRPRTLIYVPVVPLSVLDPVWGANYLTRAHAQAVFDTLYGL